jgi:hypothetical protein
MRKVEKVVCGAFVRGERCRRSNTFTDGRSLWLFGNLIARWRRGRIWGTLAGWNTVTTRSRLNAVATISGGVPVINKRHVPHVRGVEIGDEQFYAIT